MIRWRDAAAPIVLCIAILAIAGCGVIVERDGPGRTLSPNNIKDAVPRKEPRSKYGNPESYVVMGKRYYTLKTARGYSERGVASWYGKKFHGRKTSSGEIYDMYKMTAAHKGLPLPTYVQVRNLDNGRTAVVKVNDRGPFHDNRIIDLSYAAALKLDVADKGTAFVEVRALDDSGRPSGPVLTARPPSASVSSGIYLQIGAFQEHRNAVRLTDQVADVIPKNVHIREATKNGKSIYRVQVGPIVSVDIAGHALRSGHIALEDKVKVSKKAWKMEGSRMFIEAGKYVSVDDLLQGVIVQSGNDASVALAEHISGTEDLFATIMTEHARELGMTGSSFSNSTGLPDEGTFTTARDLALLSAALIEEFPTLYARFAIHEFTYNNIRQSNRNQLLGRDDTVDGIKTGLTEAAGYCLVSSADRNGTRLVAAVMGANSDTARNEASLTLINYGFRFFETRKLYERTDIIASSKVWKGAVAQLRLGAADPVHITIPRGRYDELEAIAQFNEPIVAPIDAGQVLGQMRISLDGEQPTAVPLIALDDIKAGSFFSRLYDNVLLLFE